MQKPPQSPAVRTGTSGTRRHKTRWRRAARPAVAGWVSRAPHHVAEALSADLQAQPDHGGGESEQQETKGGPLLPVEARNELRVDLLGEPLRVLAPEQRRCQVVAKRQHEHHDAAGGYARRGMRN